MCLISVFVIECYTIVFSHTPVNKLLNHDLNYWTTDANQALIWSNIHGKVTNMPKRILYYENYEQVHLSEFRGRRKRERGENTFKYHAWFLQHFTTSEKYSNEYEMDMRKLKKKIRRNWVLFSWEFCRNYWLQNGFKMAFFLRKDTI